MKARFNAAVNVPKTAQNISVGERVPAQSQKRQREVVLVPPGGCSANYINNMIKCTNDPFSYSFTDADSGDIT